MGIVNPCCIARNIDGVLRREPSLAIQGNFSYFTCQLYLLIMLVKLLPFHEFSLLDREGEQLKLKQNTREY